MLRLYNTALLPLRPVLALWAAWKGRGEQARREWGERCARLLPLASPGGIWIHGSSVGEVRVVAALARELKARVPERSVSVSAYTPTGREQLPAPPAVASSFFVPLDFSGFARRVLGALRPALLVLVETELWPNLLHEAAQCGVGVVVVNGRLSERRMRRYGRLSRLYGPVLQRLSLVCAQSSEDAGRFLALGLPESALCVTGNIKYDLPAPSGDEQALRVRLGLDAARPVFVAGSTRPGEEAVVLDAYARARARCGDLLLVLAPRHPERADEVATLVESTGLRLARLSAEPACAADRDVLLVDVMGQLAELYRLAVAAFVGGSLAPFGGHSPLEPAAAGVPVLVGPHTEHFAEPAEALIAAGGAFRVRNGSELAERLTALLEDPVRRDRVADRAGEVVRANRGAMTRTVDEILAVLRRRAPTAEGAA